MAGHWNLSKSARIIIMLVIDSVFFLLELAIGYRAQSLALIADAFHMLNDIISLLVGLWAVVVARRASTAKYSYGWLRAEILGAFFNAVFLIALCVSIFLEAITRFFDPPKINEPRLILGVGAAGLIFNIIGFFVLGGHGHSHNHGHSHGHAESDLHAAEQGQAYSLHQDCDNIMDSESSATSKPAHKHSRSDGRGSEEGSPLQERRTSTDSEISISIYPPSLRQRILGVASSHIDERPDGSIEADEGTLLIPRTSSHETTNHTGRASAAHGHGHADLGMNAMVLHVLGDALGNVGVIASALIIWLTDLPYKYYADPAVSLLITIIILHSAIPLTKATAKVLLQATPDNVDLDRIRDDILGIDGVLSCHDMHVWLLVDAKIVASMHVQVSFPISAEGGEKYMEFSKRARHFLHMHGIHSATIQPEYCPPRDRDESAPTSSSGSPSVSSRGGAAAECVDACLLNCVDNCAGQKCCSGPAATDASGGTSVA